MTKGQCRLFLFLENLKISHSRGEYHKVNVSNGTGIMFKVLTHINSTPCVVEYNIKVEISSKINNDGWLIHNVKQSQREKAALKNNEDLNVVIDRVSVCFSYMVLFDVQSVNNFRLNFLFLKAHTYFKK